MNREMAESLALRALAAIAADTDTLSRFLSLSGLTLDELRLRAAEAELLAGVLDFLLSDEALLTGFCEDLQVPATAPGAARRALPGGPGAEEPN